MWNVKDEGNGYYSISSYVDNSLLLDVYAASKLLGTNVTLWNGKNVDNQKWMLKDAGNGYFYIISKCNNLYLDVSAAKLRMELILLCGMVIKLKIKNLNLKKWKKIKQVIF